MVNKNMPMGEGLGFPEKEKKESEIDLKNLKAIFCDDEDIINYYKKESSELEDFEKWNENNKDNLLFQTDKINKLVEQGILKNNQPETIWEYRTEKILSGSEKIIQIKNKLAENVEFIKEEVNNKLKEFLPNWKIGEHELFFKMNNSADYCIDGNKITIDLGRLLFADDFMKSVIGGIAHEVFHAWMQDGYKESGQESLSVLEKTRRSVVYRMVDEGLAVLVGGQLLKEHHEKKGRDYEEYKKESFELLEKVKIEQDKAVLLKIKNEDFKDMGRCYVAEYEMAKIVSEGVGGDKFREIIKECRNNPQKMLDEYGKIKH